MSIDGPGLWDDDTSSDVRSIYRQALEDKLSDAEAREQVLVEFRECMDDPDVMPVVWISLAMVQHLHGRLDDDVREHALAVMDANLRRWAHHPALLKKRQAVLKRAATKLTGEQPRRKRVSRPPARPTPLCPGDVLGFRAPSGRYFLLIVRAVSDEHHDSFPIVQLLDWEQPGLPSASEMAALPFRSRGRGPMHGQPAEPWHLTAGITLHSRPDDFIRTGFELVAQLEPPAEEEQAQERKALPRSMLYWQGWTGYLTNQDELLTSRAGAAEA